MPLSPSGTNLAGQVAVEAGVAGSRDSAAGKPRDALEARYGKVRFVLMYKQMSKCVCMSCTVHTYVQVRATAGQEISRVGNNNPRGGPGRLLMRAPRVFESPDGDVSPIVSRSGNKEDGW